MLTEFLESNASIPFQLEQIENIIVTDSSAAVDLFFLEEINAIVIKDMEVFDKPPVKPMQSRIEILSEKDLSKLDDLGVSLIFKELVFDFLKELRGSLIGVQVSEPVKNMCPSVHVDKLPLRLVQCLDGEGTTLMTNSGREVKTQQGDLVLLKGELWKLTPGAIKHRSPETHSLRTLFRVDFLD